MPCNRRDDGLVQIASPQKIQQRTDRAAPKNTPQRTGQQSRGRNGDIGGRAAVPSHINIITRFLARLH